MVPASSTGTDQRGLEEELIQVDVMAEAGSALLIQWGGKDPKRAFVDVRMLRGLYKRKAMITKADLETGAAYGDDWESYLEPLGKTKAKSLAQHLRLAGIWVKDDITKRHMSMRVALEAVYHFEQLLMGRKNDG